MMSFARLYSTTSDKAPSMKNRLLSGVWLIVERQALRLANWARRKADTLLPIFGIAVMIAALSAASKAVGMP